MKGRPEKLEGTNEPKRRQTLSYEWDTARGKATLNMTRHSAKCGGEHSLTEFQTTAQQSENIDGPLIALSNNGQDTILTSDTDANAPEDPCLLYAERQPRAGPITRESATVLASSQPTKPTLRLIAKLECRGKVAGRGGSEQVNYAVPAISTPCPTLTRLEQRKTRTSWARHAAKLVGCGFDSYRPLL
jgi:hypothetical protein